MNVETIFAELSARARQLARRARDDAERSAELDRLNPDATLRLVRRSPAAKPAKPDQKSGLLAVGTTESLPL